MSAPIADLLGAFESHAVDEIRDLLDGGLDPLAPIDGKAPVMHLVEMYFRSDRFAPCLRLLLERGAVLDDPRLAPVLLDDVDAIEAATRHDPSLLTQRFSLACAFTPLIGVTLLHVAAEYGHRRATEKLLELGAEVDARAALDVDGLGGQTALFHTVNSNANRSAPVMKRLLQAGARADVWLDGLVWGQGFDWETVCLDLTPITYAQLGLLPQMHRREAEVYANLRTLLAACGRPVPPLNNVPNRYVAKG